MKIVWRIIVVVTAVALTAGFNHPELGLVSLILLMIPSMFTELSTPTLGGTPAQNDSDTDTIPLQDDSDMNFGNSIATGIDSDLVKMDSGINTNEHLDLPTEIGCTINPANGLPMVGGCGGVDVEGNPYGIDNSPSDACDNSSSFDDSFSAGGFNDDW